jgi:hypothetical protein
MTKYDFEKVSSVDVNDLKEQIEEYRKS